MLDIKILPKSFYLEKDVVQISNQLLGKVLVTNIDHLETYSRIVETEAYHGGMDKACHAYPNRRTPRTEVMFEEGGRSYVYLCYGLHHLFNIVTNGKNEPNAVLIRAVEPLFGIEAMEERRKVRGPINWTNGPGKLSMALGISLKLNNVCLYHAHSPIWIGEANTDIPEDIVQTTRVGVDYAQEDAFLPWRFYIRDNPFVSRP
jgi:DNA-3-methyladenine glycosylase